MKRILLAGASFLAVFAIRASGAHPLEMRKTLEVFDGISKPMISAVLRQAAQDPVKPSQVQLRERLEKAEKRKRIWERVYEALVYEVEGLEDSPDKEKLLKIFEQAEKEWKTACGEVREARDCLKSDAEILSEARLLQKIMSSFLVEKGGKTWLSETKVKVDLGQDKDALSALGEPGRVGFLRPNGIGVILENSTLTFSSNGSRDFWFSAMRDEFVAYLRLMRQRNVSKDSLRQWAEWGRKTQVYASKSLVEGVAVIPIVKESEYKDVQPKD